MAFDQLSLYNAALAVVGERPLVSLAEVREPRFQLDIAWNLGATAYCFETIKPRFATLVAAVTVSATDPSLGYANIFTLPVDYVAMVMPYSDGKLDEPITRYVIQGRKLGTDHTTLFIRYIKNADVSLWTPTFARAVIQYLAAQIAPRIVPARAADIIKASETAIALSVERDGWEEPPERSQPSTATLTAPWLQIYNDACFCMGMPMLISANDDSDRRAKLDAVLNQGAVQFLLEDYQWSWCNVLVQIDYDPDIEPEFGYQKAFEKPADLYRISGVFNDDGMHSSLKLYADEGGYLFSDNTTIYLQYITSAMTTNPLLWPMYFRKLVAAYMALQAASAAKGDVNLASAQWLERDQRAKNNDAIQAPPRIIQSGSWVRARLASNDIRRNRP